MNFFVWLQHRHPVNNNQHDNDDDEKTDEVKEEFIINDVSKFETVAVANKYELNKNYIFNSNHLIFDTIDTNNSNDTKTFTTHCDNRLCGKPNRLLLFGNANKDVNIEIKKLECNYFMYKKGGYSLTFGFLKLNKMNSNQVISNLNDKIGNDNNVGFLIKNIKNNDKLLNEMMINDKNDIDCFGI